MFFYDVNGDYRLTALDALMIINELATPPISQSGESEWSPQSMAMFTASPDDDGEDEQLEWELTIGL